MDHIYRKRDTNWRISILILLFIFSPVLSTQPDAHPGALYVVPIVLLVFITSLEGSLIRPKIVNVYAILLFIFAIFSTILSDKGSLGSGLFKYLVFILLFISISSYVMPPKQLRFSFVAYLYLSVALSVLIILSYIFGYPHIVESSGYQGRYSIGITGLFKNPNYLTSFYNVAFFVVTYIIATVELNIRKKIVLYIFLALFIISSFFSGTRAALVVEILILASIPLLYAKAHRLYKLIPIAIIISIPVVYYWSTLMDLYELFLGARDLTGDSGREEAWSYAIKFIKESPILGCGHKSWESISMGTSYLEYLHNIFLELILDQGIIGLLLVVGIVSTGYKKTKKSDRAFLVLLFFVTAFPLLFQNGLYEVNFWRFVVINRIMMNISISYEGGIKAFMRSTYGLEHNDKVVAKSPKIINAY